MVAGEPQVRSNVRVARRQLSGQAIVHDGAPDLARLEQRVAKIEVEGGGHAPLTNDLFVGCRRVREPSLLVEAVGQFERGSNVAGAGQARSGQQQTEQRHQPAFSLSSLLPEQASLWRDARLIEVQPLQLLERRFDFGRERR